MPKWFSYDKGNGFDIYDTPKEAEAKAREHLNYYREEAVEGWSEEVKSICWGIVLEKVKKISEEVTDNEAFDLIVEYEIN